MGTPDKFINLIKQLYKNTQYRTRHEDTTSQWYSQDTGIRQGCPLSPYLFLIIMTVLFYDIKNNEELKTELALHRIPGASFDEILYADDTILAGTDPTLLNIFIKFIEKEGLTTCMKLNQAKTEVLSFNAKGAGIRFANGKLIPKKDK